MVRFLQKIAFANKFLLASALAKAAVAGAGLSLAFLASIDLAIASFAKEAWDAWQVDTLINQFATVGAISGVAWQLVKLAFFR